MQVSDTIISQTHEQDYGRKYVEMRVMSNMQGSNRRILPTILSSACVVLFCSTGIIFITSGLPDKMLGECFWRTSFVGETLGGKACCEKNKEDKKP